MLDKATQTSLLDFATWYTDDLTLLCQPDPALITHMCQLLQNTGLQTDLPDDLDSNSIFAPATDDTSTPSSVTSSEVARRNYADEVSYEFCQEHFITEAEQLLPKHFS